MASSTSTIDTKEIDKFSSLAKEWWDENGSFKPLHKLNPVRIKYIKDIASKYFTNGLSGLRILDIGCGGGLLAEPMARLGAKITAIDASEKNINIAKLHAKEMDLDIDYRTITAEELLKSGEKFDIVLNMEVIEHVANVQSFLNSVSQLLDKNGLLFTATLNRTAKSFLFAIVGAEYILRWLPKHTHDWKRFLKPSEISSILEKKNLKLQDLQGVSYNMCRDSWEISRDVSVNYMMLHHA